MDQTIGFDLGCICVMRPITCLTETRAITIQWKKKWKSSGLITALNPNPIRYNPSKEEEDGSEFHHSHYKPSKGEGVSSAYHHGSSLKESCDLIATSSRSMITVTQILIFIYTFSRPKVPGIGEKKWQLTEQFFSKSQKTGDKISNTENRPEKILVIPYYIILKNQHSSLVMSPVSNHITKKTVY